MEGFECQIENDLSNIDEFYDDISEASEKDEEILKDENEN